MTGVRVLVGTRKGAFVLTSDEGRRDWQVDGPHFGGWEVYHLKGSPADPDRIWASQSGGWFGQVIQRSDDGGRTWDHSRMNQRGWPAPQDGGGNSRFHRNVVGASPPSGCTAWSGSTPRRCHPSRT